MFTLAERRGDNVGLYCGPEGLFLGPSPLIARVGAGYRMRDENEIRSLLAAAYGSSGTGMLAPRLPLIREALQQGDLCRATILAVQSRLGLVTPEGIERLVQAETLAKYNFNPDEPRDRHGRWTGLEDGAQTVATGTGDHPALISGPGALAVRGQAALIVRRTAGDDPAVQGDGPKAERQGSR